MAKDDLGCFTLIEIKKSDKTARTTIQQLFKYAHFLKAKYGLKPDQIRCIVVSTHWNELGAPFAEFKRSNPYDTKGFVLSFGAANEPHFADYVDQFQPGGNKPLDSFAFFEFSDPHERESNQERLETTLLSFSELNSVIIKVDYQGSDPRIVHPHGTAWITFTSDAAALDLELRRYCEKRNFQFEESFLQSCDEKSVDEMDHVLSRMQKLLPLSFNSGEMNYQGLHSLNNVLQTWKYEQLVTIGPMFSGSLYRISDPLSDNDVRESIGILLDFECLPKSIKTPSIFNGL